MILLDTHIWVWWVHGDTHLSRSQAMAIEEAESDGIGVSVISCWEVAKLVEYGRLDLNAEVGRWLSLALAYPGVALLPLTPDIMVESTRLPGDFHRDPADRMIVATARQHWIPLVTSDEKLIRYAHVRTLPRAFPMPSGNQ
uniref:PIN domain nuclease, a component of toxin-antitoxin system (PIN domain) n=1 Tax=Candidatus Kentrum sp. LPFa TaxID=2126335 RepID=A0A450WMP8_9GAMM|nr:MAG: PIN domain nuclease, a component of toxin-antitoxin system (PIN domain) [Candidatus Kentron sp. LPFa]VFK33123.1 MAG: PIN domain nuclease, a component of toxin-antitoxin system (PIN domain) [Candidatus Kentron sp. LPFa]